MSNIREAVLNIARAWARDLMQGHLVAGAYVFGSIVRPDRFIPGRSDLDLLLTFSPSVRTPLARVSACERLLERKRELEVLLEAVIKSPLERVPIVSVLLLTPFELDNAIHKGRDHRFFSTARFIDLVKPSNDQQQIGSAAAETFRLVYPGLIPAIQRTQDCRNKFLSIDANGIRKDLKAWDHEIEALPKDMCRAAAPLRYFERSSSDDTEFDPVAGLGYITDLVRNLEQETPAHRDLHEWLTIRGGGHAPRTPLSPERQLFLWEILAQQAELLIRRRERMRLIDQSNNDPGPVAERAFLEAVAKPSLHIGGRSIECKLLPEFLWKEVRNSHLYQDDPEAERRIDITISELAPPLPANTLDTLVQEIGQRLSENNDTSSKEHAILSDVYKRLTDEGSNAYPRVVALPRIDNNRTPLLMVQLGPSRYGIALVEERQLSLPTAVQLRSSHILNSLAVRVAYIYKMGQAYWVECHQRKGGPNATYKNSWDVGAAGYIDPNRHKDPLDENRTSVWQAAAAELSEELGIPKHQLPHSDHYYFFGMGRNDPTGQLDILGYCMGVHPLSPNREVTKRVKAFDRCELNPKSVAAFVRQKRNWVPTALLTLILTLEAFGYSKDEIEHAFATVITDVELGPDAEEVLFPSTVA
jgi:predicted nucleotidyltransferase